jgi:DNA-binding response OmpR family regulator
MPRLVLIVDDNGPLAEGLAEILECEGYAAKIFTDPLVALREASALPFDVALLDVRMPGMDGVALQQHLLKIRPDAQVLLMTAYAEDQRIAQGLAAGARAVLTKPVAPSRLLKALGHDETREVLIVEDDAAFRDALAELLSEDGYRCHRAGSAGQARKLMAELRESGNHVALALIDLRLPDESGFVLARELTAAAEVSCILMTGWNLADEAPERAATRLLVKPFAPDELLRTLAELRSVRA